MSIIDEKRKIIFEMIIQERGRQDGLHPKEPREVFPSSDVERLRKTLTNVQGINDAAEANGTDSWFNNILEELLEVGCAEAPIDLIHEVAQLTALSVRLLETLLILEDAAFISYCAFMGIKDRSAMMARAKDISRDPRFKLYRYGHNAWVFVNMLKNQ